MRILCFALVYWHDERLQNYAQAHPMLRLEAWAARMKCYFSPTGLFLASGTWSDPWHNPIPEATLVNAGAIYDGPYEGNRRHYGKAAMAGAMAYALNRNDWDLLVHFDTDALFGAVDLNSLMRDFMQRPELMVAPGWLGLPGGPLTAWKREGASRVAHYRQTSNLKDSNEEPQMIWEAELAYIFRDGKWWNPWPELKTCMNDGSENRMSWPMISKIPEDFVELYALTQSICTRPVIP